MRCAQVVGHLSALTAALHPDQWVVAQPRRALVRPDHRAGQFAAAASTAFVAWNRRSPATGPSGTKPLSPSLGQTRPRKSDAASVMLNLFARTDTSG